MIDQTGFPHPKFEGRLGGYRCKVSSSEVRLGKDLID